MSSVREALVASVTRRRPPVRCQITKRVDRPRGQLAGLGAVAGVGNMVEHPGDLGRREVRVDDQAGPLGDLTPGRGLSRSQSRGRPAVLPDQGRGDRLGRSARSQTTVVSR